MQSLPCSLVERTLVSTARQVLTEETRKKVIENLLLRLTGLVHYAGKRHQLAEVIRLQPRQLAVCTEEGRRYRPFVGRY